MHLAVGKAAGWTLSLPAEVKSVSDYETALETWCEKDSKVHHIMVNTLPNPLLMCLINKDSAHEYFTALSTLFEQQSLVATVALSCDVSLLSSNSRRVEMHMCIYIDKLIALCEELASVGHLVADEDMFSFMYASLPQTYNPGLASISSTMHLQNKTFTADELMDVVFKEYDHLTLQDSGKGKKSSRTGEDAAFGVDASKKGKGNHHKAKSDGNCNNCS